MILFLRREKMKLSSLEKSLILIETLAEHPRGLTLSRLSELCGQPVSSIHHALSTFRERGFVAQNEETKKYSLGLKFLTISRAILDNLDIRTVAMEELQRLHDKTHEMVFLSVLRDRKVVYIDKIQAPGRLVLATEVGYAIEPHACTSGKALLAGLSDREIMDLYPDEALPPHHGNTIINTRTALLEELRKVREQGFSYGDEQYYQGVRGVAAPLVSGRKTIACICVTGPVFSMPTDRIYTEIIPNVLESAAAISRSLNG